ncbi:MAG: DUF4252 domain-containing protein [Muribaculaceae bacterium]|nr:DUF4252 domain-containing protein [Muribaculaceae bacterium]MDE6553733.1 DUF4252 domain-containing protein [Muribaculaceae bacterium]
MKSIKPLLCALLCIMTIISCSAQRTFSEIASQKGVTSVFVGKTMLKLAGSSMSLAANQSAIDVSKIIKDLSSIEIINCDDIKVLPAIKNKCKKILAEYPLEVITEVTDDGEKVEISGVLDKDGHFMEMLLISVSDDDEITFILMKGKIDVVTLNNAIFAN